MIWTMKNKHANRKVGDISMKKCKQLIDIVSIILLIIEICLLFYFAYINWSKIAGIINIYIILAVTFFVGFRILLDKSNIIKEVFCIFLNVFILSSRWNSDAFKKCKYKEQ